MSEDTLKKTKSMFYKLISEYDKQRRHRKWALKKARSYLHKPCSKSY